ncbi:MAG: NAD(P)H-dependent oxidoreductase subunit E [Dehalococcoidia bacterium]
MATIPYDPDGPDATERLREARAAVDALPRERPQLLPAFLAAQHALRWLPREAIEHVAEHTRIPVSEVYATATAYSELLLQRPEPGTWYVCTGIACDMAGAPSLIEAAPGRTRAIDCQFLCALAPVVHDDQERLYGRVSAANLAEQAARR